MKTLFEVTLLTELGFTRTQAARLVEGNHRLVDGFQAFYEI